MCPLPQPSSPGMTQDLFENPDCVVGTPGEDLDGDDISKDNLCWGRLKGGRRCFNRTRAVSGDSTTATSEQTHRLMLPTCKIHTKQQFIAGICQARLQRGTQCNAKFRWEPHGFSLCSTHAQTAGVMPCYFLKIPTELRCRIYSYLLPDQRILARFSNSSMLRSDSEPCYPQILRVNHQIYEEATIVLYARNTFEVEISGGANNANIFMCNSCFGVHSFPTPNRGRPFSVSHTSFMQGHATHGNHALQDYQMQLMLLEQQNKRRLLMARQERAGFDHAFVPPLPPTGPPLPRSRLADVTYLSFDPSSHSYTSTWHPGCLSHANIDMIRSFQVNIMFPCVPQPPINQGDNQPQQSLIQQLAAQQAAQQQQQQQQQIQMTAQQQTLFQQQLQNMSGVIPPPSIGPNSMIQTLPPPSSASASPSYNMAPPAPPPNSTSQGFPPAPTQPPPISIAHGPQPMGIMLPQQGPPGTLMGVTHTTLSLPPTGPLPQRSPWAEGCLERAKYEICDALNQVVERLQLLPLSILRLNVDVHIGQYETQEPALAAAQLFLNTFRGLRNVVRPNVNRTIWVNQFWQDKEILYNLMDISVNPTTSSEFVNQWRAEISQQGPAPDLSPVVYTYWVLHHICFDLHAHHGTASVLDSNADIHSLLLRAKVAREEQDQRALRDVGQEIRTIWQSYILKQRTFEKRVSRGVAFIDGLLDSDNVQLPHVQSSSSMRIYEGKGKGRAEDVDDVYRRTHSSIIEEEEEESLSMDGNLHLCS